MAEVTIRIDGREVTVDAGMNLIEAARRLGIEIPHYCYHPGLGVDGNCRMCLVEVEGQPKPAIACNTFARDVKTKDGVRPVFTASPKVKEWQRAVLEFLLINHPLDCPICDQAGECFLQDYYMANGQYASRLDTPKLHKRKVVDVGPRVKLDAERCVLCTRCVRFCDEVTGTGELAIVNRGNRSEITSFPACRWRTTIRSTRSISARWGLSPAASFGSASVSGSSRAPRRFAPGARGAAISSRS